MRFLFLICIACLPSSDSYSQESIQSLVQSELAFARAAAEKGIKESFLAYLAYDSVLFRPRAVPGKKWIADHPDPQGLLSWEPSYAEISGAGDLGFTTGPFTFSASAQDAPSGFGQFFSIWQKQLDNTWKVVLDAGINHEKQDGKISLSSRSGLTTTSVSKEQQRTEQRVVASYDMELSRSFTTGFIAEDVIILRNLQPPLRGRGSAEKFQSGSCTFKQDKVHMAQSADLAYTYGTYQCPAESGVYVRVWRKEDAWRVALDYMRSDS